MPVRDVKMTNGVSTAATEKFPAYIPQTMEWALSQAQSALAAALSDDLRRIIVELPMGRTRKFWTRQAPRDSWLRETAVLASHITHFVEGADIRVVLGEKCPPSTCVEPWISERHILKSSMTADFLGSTLPADSLGATSESTIVFAVGVLNNQQTALRKMIETIPESVPLVLFNCFMDVPMDSKLFPPEFVPTYMCRSLKRCAFARYGHRAPYHVFVEVSLSIPDPQNSLFVICFRNILTPRTNPRLQFSSTSGSATSRNTLRPSPRTKNRSKTSHSTVARNRSAAKVSTNPTTEVAKRASGRLCHWLLDTSYH